MNLLFYRYGSICELDIISAFEELGHTVSQISEEVTNKNITYARSAELVSNYLLEHPQDFVFTINFSRRSPAYVTFLRYRISVGLLTLRFWNFLQQRFRVPTIAFFFLIGNNTMRLLL